MAHDLRRGAVFMVTSALLFALMGVGVKAASETLPSAMVVFFRNAVGLAVLAPWAAGMGLAGLRTTKPREHLVRGMAGLGAMYCFFYAIAHLRLADAVLLNYSLPLFVPFVESAWLGERFERRLWWPILVGFGGIVLILRPGSGIWQLAALAGLLAALFAAMAQVGIRRLTATEPVARIIFYFALIATAGSALPLLGAWRTPRGREWAWLVATGVVATAGQLFLTRAYGQAPAARVGPFIYTSVVFAALLDGLIWGRIPDPLTVAGMLVVGAASILALRMEARRHPGPPAPPPPA